jgi:hypothetical protein
MTSATIGGSEFERLLASRDVALFERIESQTTPGDRTSLLSLELACRRVQPGFSYLEIGSHLGGSLQVLVRDPLCGRLVSLDPRPSSQPDARGERFDYTDNRTRRMLELLESIPDADLSKLETVDLGTDRVVPDDIDVRPLMCFVDGEHTNEAALRDARFCRTVVERSGVIVFHDRGIVAEGIAEFLEEVGGEVAAAYPLRDSVFVVELGSVHLRDTDPVRGVLSPITRSIWHAVAAQRIPGCTLPRLMGALTVWGRIRARTAWLRSGLDKRIRHVTLRLR